LPVYAEELKQQINKNYSEQSAPVIKLPMKISISIPQYNRISYLLKSLETIARQTYPALEIVVSDDCSTDDTEKQITELIPFYKYPLVYHRNRTNMGYDRNYRQCIELASGEYVVVIGNDDTLNPQLDIGALAAFLQQHDYPELGFCNFLEESTGNTFIERAQRTALLGSGYPVAIKNYSCFSFVGGLIYKRTAFGNFNTEKHDGSIYAQMYLGCVMVASGCRLFSYYDPLVIKDIVLEDSKRNSYRDVLARRWKDYKVEDGGLPSVINVLIDAFRDAGVLTQSLIYFIFKRIYTVTYPYWIVDYKSNGALPAAVGLTQGLRPDRNKNFKLLTFLNRVKLRSLYVAYSFAALIMPVFIFNAVKNRLYKKIKRS
jgi:glycosyltransferase involved in cell wall biosynthesis